MSEWNLYIRVVGEVAVDSDDHLTFDLHGKDTQASPVPKVYIDNVLQSSAYTFNDGDQSTQSSITFDSEQTGIITATYRWKRELDDDEDASVYEVDKEANILVEKDVNGRTIVAISYTPTANFMGILQWEYMLKEFWEEWVLIVDNAYTFDIERTSDADEPRTLSNLLATLYPRWIEIPGVPERIHVGIEFVQL